MTSTLSDGRVNVSGTYQRGPVEAYYIGPTMKQTGPTMEEPGPTMEEPGPSIEEPGPTIEEPGP